MTIVLALGAVTVSLGLTALHHDSDDLRSRMGAGAVARRRVFEQLISWAAFTTAALAWASSPSMTDVQGGLFRILIGGAVVLLMACLFSFSRARLDVSEPAISRLARMIAVERTARADSSPLHTPARVRAVALCIGVASAPCLVVGLLSYIVTQDARLSGWLSFFWFGSTMVMIDEAIRSALHARLQGPGRRSRATATFSWMTASLFAVLPVLMLVSLAALFRSWALLGVVVVMVATLVVTVTWVRRASAITPLVEGRARVRLRALEATYAEAQQRLARSMPPPPFPRRAARRHHVSGRGRRR